MTKKYSISVISNSCGIKPHTIRIWEKRYNLFSPDRSNKGQRLYDDDDIIKAKLVATLIKGGHKVSALANYSIQELTVLKSEMKHGLETTTESNGLDNLKTILEHLEYFRIDAVANELRYSRLNSGAREFILNVILPIIREIGNLVYEGKYTVTQEHIVSTIIRDQLSQIYLPNLGKDKHHIALATPEGNLHEFSILIADILCRSHRFTTHYLGPTHPADCLAEALSALDSEILVLGVISSDQWDYGKNMIPYLKKMDENLSHELIVILGGGQELAFPEFKNIKEVKILKTFDNLDEYLENLY